MYVELRRRYELNEYLALALSVIVVALVFTGWEGIITSNKFRLATAFIGVSTAFLFHELAHRAVARKFGCYARYVISPLGLIITLLTVFTPIKIIMTGYVGIICPPPYTFGYGYGYTDPKRLYALIAMAGPLTNIALSVIFYSLTYAPLPLTYLRIFNFAAEINAWIAFFNLIPIPPLDGSKIFTYNPILSIFLVMVSVVLMVVVF